MAGLNLRKAEFSDMKHQHGVVSAARIPGKDCSGGAQFFVCVSPQRRSTASIRLSAVSPNVRRFLTLIATGWFDGTAFHRVVKGFVAQGVSRAKRSSWPNHAADRWVGPLKGEFRAEVAAGPEVLDAFDKEEMDGETPKRRLEIIAASIDPQ